MGSRISGSSDTSEWQLATLDNLAVIMDNRRVPVREEDRPTGSVPYYGANGQQGWIDRPLFDEPLILLAEDGGHFDEFADRPIAYRIDGPSWVNNHAHVLRAATGVDQNFLYWSLRNKDIRRWISGGTRSKLTRGEMEQVVVPVPPLEEQRRIAEILDTIDETIQATERIIAKRETQLYGLAAYLMSPSAPFRKWEERRLAEWTRPDCPITYGMVQAGPHIPDGIPYIRTGDMTTELCVEGLLRTSPQIAQRYSRSRVSEGDIVCAIRATVGKVLIVPLELDGANLTQGTARIAPGLDADRFCLLWALRSNEIRRQIRAVQKGTTFQEITLEQLRSLVVRLPTDLVDQRQLTTPLLATEAVIQTERSTLDKLKKLQSGLATDLLSSRVRTVAS